MDSLPKFITWDKEMKLEEFNNNHKMEHYLASAIDLKPLLFSLINGHIKHWLSLRNRPIDHWFAFIFSWNNFLK